MARRRQSFTYHVPPEAPWLGPPSTYRREAAPRSAPAGFVTYDDDRDDGFRRPAPAPAPVRQPAPVRPRPPAPARQRGPGDTAALGVVWAAILIVIGTVGYGVTHKPTTIAASNLRPPDLKTELIVVNDLPAGFTVSSPPTDHGAVGQGGASSSSAGSSSNAGASSSDSGMPACFVAADQGANPTAEADASYKQPGEFVQEILEWVPGTGATNGFAVASKAFSSCGTITISDSGFSGTGAMAQMSMAPVGDQSAAWSVPMAATANGQQFPMTEDIVLVQVQQTIMEFTDTTVGGAPDAAQLQANVQRAVSKIP